MSLRAQWVGKLIYGAAVVETRLRASGFSEALSLTDYPPASAVSHRLAVLRGSLPGRSSRSCGSRDKAWSKGGKRVSCRKHAPWAEHIHVTNVEKRNSSAVCPQLESQTKLEQFG